MKKGRFGGDESDSRRWQPDLDGKEARCRQERAKAAALPSGVARRNDRKWNTVGQKEAWSLGWYSFYCATRPHILVYLDSYIVAITIVIAH
jgi:hypothetical protein